MKPPCLEDLIRCRELIDAIDVRLVELLNERAAVVEEIGRVKQNLTLGIYEPKREEQVFENIRKSNSGPLPLESLQRIYERIIDEMRTIQKLKMLQNDNGSGQ